MYVRRNTILLQRRRILGIQRKNVGKERWRLKRARGAEGESVEDVGKKGDVRLKSEPYSVSSSGGKMEMNKKQHSAALFVDLSKAFDWFRNYRSDRTQCVSTDNH